MTKRGRAFDGRVLGALLILNLVAHFTPFARPGFQPDDFTWLHHAHIDPPWSFVGRSLSQETRPLGWLLYILMPRLFGLDEWTQLIILVATTTLLTSLTYFFLLGCLTRPLANLATLAFVVWPVKHEIYASQLFGVITWSGILIVGAGLLYRRWVLTRSSPALGLAVLCYGLSIFTYEIGYAAPLVFYLTERGKRPRAHGVLLFLIPAALYWVFRIAHADAAAMGKHDVSIAALVVNLLTTLPSNLLGYQVARNVGYGLWGLINASWWSQLCGAIAALGVGIASARWIREGQGDARVHADWKFQAPTGLLCAALLAAPAAMVLVESRHSMLAAAGMGVAVAALAVRLRPVIGATALVMLLLSTQGLAARQAEASQLQAAVYRLVEQRVEEIRSASVVVLDMSSLAKRLPYTWGDQRANVLRAYWGIHAFAGWGLGPMVEAALDDGTNTPLPRVVGCATSLVVSNVDVSCARDYGKGEPFAVPRTGTVVIDFKTMPLPSSIKPSSRGEEFDSTCHRSIDGRS